MGPQLALHKKRFEADPGAEASFAVLEEHHFMAQEWTELVSLYEMRLGASSLPAPREDLLLRLGRILEERCGDPEGAIERYTEALRAQPSLRAAMTSLRRIYARREAWEQMFSLAESEAELSLKPHERAGLLFEVGKICLDAIQDPGRARSYLDRALGEVPVHRESLAALARALEKLDEPAEAIRVLKRLAQQTKGLDQARAFQEAGRLSVDRLNQMEQAGHYFRAALEIDPSMQAAREDLARLEIAREAESCGAEVGDEGRRLKDDLEEKSEEVISLVDEMEPPGPDLESPPSVESRLEAAALAAARGDHSDAIANLELAVQQNPAQIEPLELLADILGAVDVLKHLADATLDPTRRGAVLTRLGNCLEQNLDDPEEALAAYESALQADPTLLEPFDALCQLNRKTGNWNELRSLLEGFRRFGAPVRRVRTLVQLGELLEGHFEDLAGAVCAYEEALELEPEGAPAQEALARLTDSAPQKERWIGRYVEQAQTTTDPVQRRELADKLVPLLEQVNRPEEALAWASRIAGESGGDRKILEMVARLQELLGLEGELRETLENLDAFLVESERARNRGHIAELHMASGQRDSAITTYQRVLAVEPSNRQALEALVPLLTEAESWFELAKVRESLTEILDSPAREGCLSELAKLYIERLEDLETGIRILQRLEDDRNPPPDLGQHLDELLVRAGHFDQLAQRLAQRRAKLEPDSQQFLAVAREEARIRAQHLGQWREAIDVLREAAGVFDDPEGLAELEGYARSAQDDVLLVEVLAERAARAGDSQAGLRIATERARVLEGLPGRGDEARDAYRALLSEHPDEATRAEILQRLEALLRQSEDWSALREVLEHELESATPRRAAQLQERLGWLCHTHLREAAAAAAHFEELVLHQPDATEAWRQLALHYALAQQPQDERRVVEGWLATVPGAPEVRELHARIARLCSRLGDADAALSQYSKVFEFDRSDAEASEFLCEAHRRGGRMSEAVKVLESRLAALGEIDEEGAQEAARLLRPRIAEQRADALEDLAGAIAVLEPAVGEGSEFERYAEPLAALYERAGCPEELIELSKRFMAVTSAPGDRARWQLRIAEASQACGLEDEAIAAYRSLLALRPSYPRVEHALAELYRARGEAEPLVELLETRLERLRGAPAVALHVECAGLLEERLARSGPALDHLRRALAIDPERSRAIQLGLGIADHLGDASVELEFLEHVLAGATPIGDRCRRLARLGELQLANGKAEEAVSRWSEALTLDPRQPALCTRLREQLEELGRTDEALHWLAAEVDQAGDEASTALCERGVVLAAETSGPEAALAWLERLWRLRPTDASVAARLANLNEQLGRHAAALRALEAQRSLARADEVLDIEMRRARIYEDQLGLPARAIACLEDARIAAPDATGVLQRLEGLYARAGRHRERAEVLEALLPSTSPEARVERMRELAKLWGGPLASPERATPYLHDALREAEQGAPETAALLAELSGFLAATDRRFEWAQVTERELRVRLAESRSGSESEACCVLRLHLARAYERELCRPDLALSHWEKLVDAEEQATPDAPASFDRDEAEAALLRLLRAQGRLVELERRLTAHVERRVGGSERWVELANLRERLQLVSEASAAWHQVLELDAESIEGVRGVQRAAERLAQWPDLAQMIERELELASNAPAGEQATLLRRLAEVRLHRLEDSRGARTALERVLVLGEEDLETLRTLETLLESFEDWEATLDVYRKEIEHLGQEEPARRRSLWLRIATIERQQNDAPERALKALRQADSLDPLTGELLCLRAELELALDDRKAYARTMARWCDDPSTGSVAGDHVKLARLLDELGQRADAAARIERAVSEKNVDGQVWALAGELREKNGDPAGASRAYVRTADASDGDEAALFLGKAAALLEDTDFAGACELLNRAIHLSRCPIPSLHARRILAAAELGRHADVPASAICIAELEGYARSAQDDALLVEVLSGRAARAGDPQAGLRIATERARVLEGLPGRGDEARDAYRALLSEHPDEATRAEILQRLEAMLEQSEDWSALREVLEHELESATPRRAAQLRERLGWLCHTHLRDAAAAAAHFEELVLHQPDATEAWRQLALHYALAQQPQDERRAVEGWLAMTPDAPESRELHARIARLCSRLGDTDAALAQYSKVFELDRTDAEASEFLCDAHRRGGRVSEAVKVLESRLAAIGEVDEEGAQEPPRLLRLRIAEQRADALEDLAGAIAVLEPAVGEGSEFERYAEPLAALYERAGCPEELIELSKRFMAVTTAPGDRARWQLRIAEASQACGLEDEAIAAYRSLLALRPSYPRVEHALAELYRARGEAEPLVELLETRLERLRGASAVALHVECADLLEERLSRSGPALDHLRRALAIDPGHSRAIELGLGIAKHLGDASVEFEFLEHMLAGATPIRDRCGRLARLGELQLANGKAVEAVSSWSESLTLDPRQPALCTRLREQFEELGKTDEALRWLAAEVDQAGDEASTALCERGVVLAADTSGPEAALAWLERLWRLRPTDASVAARLANLNEQLGRHAAALRALEAQRSLARADEVPDIEMRRARIYEDQLGLPARAIACLEDARIAAPDATGVLQRLEGLYARAGRHRERAEVLEALLPSTSPEARVERMRELAKLWGGPLANPERATPYLNDALREAEEGAPETAALLAELSGFLAATGRRFEWAQVTERELRVRLAESRSGSESQACCVLRLHLARAYERELCRPDLALSHWEKLVDAEEQATPGASASFDRDEAEAALLRLLRAQGRLVELERRLTAHVKRKAGGVERWVELANLRERLQLVPGASAAWRQVLKLDAESIEGVRGVQRAAERLAQWPDLAQMIERELELASNAPAGEQATLLRRLAEVRLHRLEDSRGARTALERVLVLGEEDLETLRTLETLLESFEDWEATLDVYRKEIEHLGQEEPARRRSLWLRIATIERQQNDAPERALKALRQADSLDPLTGELLCLRAELELALDDRKAYARTMARWCDDPSTGSVAGDHVKLARLLDELGQRADAAARIERAVSEKNVDAQVWALAGELREKDGDPAGASRAYVRAADASDGDEAALFLGKAAALLEDTDFAGACELLNRAVHVSRRQIPSIHARRILAAAELGRHADVLDSAICIHELAETQADVLERDELLNLLMVGARSARTLERAEVMAQLCGAVRKLEPDHEEALAGAAEAFFALESWGKARQALEQLLSFSEGDPQRAQDLSHLGIVLERLQTPSEAADTYRMALDLDPDLEDAGEGLIRALRDSGRLTECLDALLERARLAASTPLCADGFLRAAEIALELGRHQEAIDHLRTAREADPDNPRSWLREVELLAEVGESEAADALAAEGLEQLADATARAELALRRGRTLEAGGNTSEAADLYVLAAELDSNQVPAALGAARMLQSSGEAERASDFLSHFLAAFPSVDTYASAPVWLAAGQLRAGPVNDPQGAAEAYRRALGVAPDLTLARDALAELLVRLPDSQEEAISLHARILTDRPTDLSSLRALLTLAEAGGDERGVANGLAVLTALGAATPEERERSEGHLRLAVAGAARFEDGLWECARNLLRVGSKALNQILEYADPSESESGEPVTRFRRAAREAEAKMTAAGCVSLDDGELRDLVVALAGLAVGSTGTSPDRAWAPSLPGAIGWLARLRLKRALEPHSPSEIADMDFSAWRGQLRRMARARALDATEGDLSAALVAVISDSKGLEVRGLDPESNLAPLVGDCPAGRDLMRDVALCWARSLSPTTRQGGFLAID